MKAEFFVKNRESVMSTVDCGVVVLSAYSRLQRSNDSAHSFTQEANFWYLTGVNEPDWLLIIDRAQRRSWLVKPETDEVHETFDGSLAADEAKIISGVDAVITSDEAIPLLRKLASSHSLAGTIGKPSHAEYFNFALNPSVARNWHMLERQFNKVEDIQKQLAKQRAIKQPDELVMIRRAIKSTMKAFEKIHDDLPTYKSEYEIESVFSFAIRSDGAQGHAYDPIIAAGRNACTLHYSRNDQRLTNRSLVLMDVGASYGNYCADITRTYAKGEPTKRQKQVHRAVEAAHHQIIGLIKPLVSVEEYQHSVDEIMKETIRSLGLDHSEAGIRKYFPHAISHGLGLDVHDSLGGPKHFEAGMVLTVEPGIYIPEEKIGVRIEDDILVTSNARLNLSGDLSTGL